MGWGGLSKEAGRLPGVTVAGGMCVQRNELVRRVSGAQGPEDQRKACISLHRLCEATEGSEQW